MLKCGNNGYCDFAAFNDSTEIINGISEVFTRYLQTHSFLWGPSSPFNFRPPINVAPLEIMSFDLPLDLATPMNLYFQPFNF